MTTKVRRTSGFWIRLLARLIDFALAAALSITIGFALLEKNGDNWVFIGVYAYYLWTLITCLIFAVIFFLIPLFFNATPGMAICGIRLIFAEEKLGLLRIKKISMILLHEVVFALGWIFTLILAAVFINHTLINELINVRGRGLVDFDAWGKIRVGVVSTAAGFLVVAQLFAVLGIIARPDKLGFHDRLAKVKVVWSRRFIVTKNTKGTEMLILVTPVSRAVVEWV